MIFIGGDGRSGTTLLSVMLDSHPAIVCMPELHFNSTANLGADVLEGRNQSFVARVERAGVPPDTLRFLIRSHMELGFEFEDFRERTVLIGVIADECRRATGKKLWGMKIMREIQSPGRYLDRWPEAKFLCMVRDPRDVFASQKQWPTWGYTEATEAGQGFVRISDRFGEFVKETECGMFVRYETLVAEPEATMLAVCGFLRIGYSEEMLRHADHQHALTSSRVSHYSKEQVRKPLNDSSIGRWRRDLIEAEVREIEDVAGDFMRIWGYDE